MFIHAWRRINIFIGHRIAIKLIFYRVYIKENGNINAISIYKIPKERKKRNCFYFYFRTTVNRTTFVGKVGRTNEGRVWVVDGRDDVVTKPPVKSLVLLSYIDESSTNPLVVVVVVWEIGKVAPAVVRINCCDCWEDGTVARRNVVCCCRWFVVPIRRI